MRRAIQGRFGMAAAVLVGTVAIAAGAAEPAEAAEVPDSATDVKPLLIGAEVPDVTVRKPDGTEVRLRAAVQETPAVLIFFRGGW